MKYFIVIKCLSETQEDGYIPFKILEFDNGNDAVSCLMNLNEKEKYHAVYCEATSYENLISTSPKYKLPDDVKPLRVIKTKSP